MRIWGRVLKRPIGQRSDGYIQPDDLISSGESFVVKFERRIAVIFGFMTSEPLASQVMNLNMISKSGACLSVDIEHIGCT